MATISFFARGDSNTANNAYLNAQNTSTTPTTEITFSSGTSGDLRLEPNGGSPDPDTTVIIDGVEMTFTVNFSGALPETNKLKNVNGVDLRGEPIVVITTEDGQRLFFLVNGVSEATMDDFPNGAHDLTGFSTTFAVPVCFTKGTEIRTPDGERPVENLKIGDLVATADGSVRPVQWIAKRHFSFCELLVSPKFRPVCIQKNLLGPGLPEKDLWLSPQHRVIFSGWEAELLFRKVEVFLPALSFLTIDRAPIPNILNGVTYYHLLFEKHEVIWANGLPSESLFLGDSAIASMSNEAREDLRASFPQYRKGWSSYGDTARLSLSRKEGELLLAYAAVGARRVSDAPGCYSQAA